MSPCLSSLLLLLSLSNTALTQNAAPLSIAAAADLSKLAPELQSAYCQSHKPCTVRFVFSASAILRQQIEAGAPFDIFLSANSLYVDELAKSGKLAPSTVMTYASGRVGVLWRNGKKHPLRDLATPAVRFIALPNPKLAPYGVAAQQALEHSGLWSIIQPKVVYAENVTQALQMVESGNADATLTAASLLYGRDAEILAADWHKPIIQKAGVLAASSQQEQAKQFLRFLQSPQAQALLARYGFSPAPANE